MAAMNEEQEAEIFALKSIFDENTLEIASDDSVVAGGRFIIDVDAPSGASISLLVGSGKDGGETVVTVDHLSPLYLSFTLDPSYPSESPPSFKFQALWLTPNMVTRLRSQLEQVWEECPGSAVLFNWYQSIKEHVYGFIDQPLPLSECQAPVAELVNALTDYDRLRKRHLFETSYVYCDVCCRELLGAECEQLTPCGHVFCKECCRSYLCLQVQEGALDRLKCLADDCQSTIAGQQLRSILGPDLFARYDQLSLSRGLDSMADIVQCPRPDCGAPVLTDGPESKMASCALCHLPFCLYCKKVFHGVAPCSFSLGDKKRIVEEYKTATGEVKAKMEKRYGKQALQRLVEESMSEEWIGEHSKACPHCRMGIEKNDGCNKMSCSKCGTYFCWLCMRILNDIDPYKHFSDPKAPCYNKLFQGMVTDDQDGVWFLR